MARLPVALEDRDFAQGVRALKAVLCREHGPPESLTIGTTEVPSLRSTDVQIKVGACAINFPDMLIVAGRHQMSPPLPFIPGGEVAGTVAAVGSDVSDLACGDRVMAITYLGGLADFVNAPRSAVHPWPEEMPLEVAAGFAGAYATALHALKQRAELRAGQTLLVLGAAGGIGLAAVQLGKAMGARVIAGAGSDEKAAFLRANAADAVINYTTADLREEIRAIAGRMGVDVVCDPVGGDLFDQAVRCMAWGGRLVVIGFASGRIPDFAVNLALLKGTSVVGVNYARFVEEQPDEAANNIRELFDLYADNRLDPHVARAFPITETARAMNCLNNRDAIGKVVVTLSRN